MPIDVITIARDCPRGLRSTLRSLSDQVGLADDTLRSVVVVSPVTDADPTLAVARSVDDRQRRVVEIQRGRGIAGAFNQGLDHCRPDSWVLFLNAGDTLASDDVIARVSSVLSQAQAVAWATGGVLRLTASRVTMPRPPRSRMDLASFASGNPLCHQATFYRASAFPGRYRPSLRQGMDFDLNIRFYRRYGEPYRLSFPISHYDLTGVSSVRVTDWARHLYLVQRLNGLVPQGGVARTLWELRILARLLRRMAYVPLKLARW